jgi:hypothetical protein
MILFSCRACCEASRQRNGRFATVGTAKSNERTVYFHISRVPLLILPDMGSTPIPLAIISTKIKKNMELKEKQVIVRGDRSGVFFGVLSERNGKEVELKQCRRLWYWSGAASLSQLALEGVKNPENCKFTVTLDSLVILDAIEIIPCTQQAIESINSVRIWKH